MRIRIRLGQAELGVRLRAGGFWSCLPGSGYHTDAA